MSLRIAFDLDGVLTDLGSAYTAIAGRLFVQSKPPVEGAVVPGDGDRPSSGKVTAKAAHAEEAADPGDDAESVEQELAVTGLSRR